MLKTLLPFLFLFVHFSDVNTACEADWTAYEDEKCFRLFNHLVTYTDALAYCQTQNKESTLAKIKTKGEQDAINAILKQTDIANNVWTGITKNKGIFKNFDQTELSYTNWADNRPLKNSTGLDCVELSTDEANYGKWFDEKCAKANAVICQKSQVWSISKLQDSLLDLKKQLSEHAQQLIPIGFIYIQLPNQSEPGSLWPNTQWKNISMQLSGLFFRVEGGQSDSFGNVQEQQTHSIEVHGVNCNRTVHCSNGDGYIYKIQANPGGSDMIYTGNTNAPNSGERYVGIYFKQNQEEIRPKNSAIRIWQRIK